MDELLRVLKRSILFSDLSEEAIKNEILPLGKLREVPKGHYLIRFQERYEYFNIIIRGKINIQHIYGNGNYAIIDVLEEAELCGADLICTNSCISPYFAVAMQPTQVLTFPAWMVLQPGSMNEDVRLSVLNNMLIFIADENMRKEYRLAILFQKGLRDRIMTFLTMQANKKHADTFSVPFTRDEMASYLCVNRTCLSHELSLMAQEGIIKFHRNTFTLLNWDGKNEEY